MEWRLERHVEIKKIHVKSFSVETIKVVTLYQKYILNKKNNLYAIPHAVMFCLQLQKALLTKE